MDQELIARLKSHRQDKGKVLSVYLSADEERVPYPSFFLSQFNSLIHKFLTDDQRNFWSKDIDRVKNYLASIDRSSHRSLAIFSSGVGLWETLDFEFFLKPQLHISEQPFLKPIEQAISKYKKYLVLLIDREKARLFTVHLGKIEEHKDFFFDAVPQKVKAKTINWGRDKNILLDIEKHLHLHLKLVLEKTREFIRGKDISFIIIGSHKALMGKIKRHLKYPLNNLVLGEFVTELNIPLNSVLEHSKLVARKINNSLALKKIRP